MRESRGTVDKITDWLRAYAAQARADGYVVGLSGGIDSACTAVLCQRAMGARVIGVLMPCHSLPADAEMARLVADRFGIETHVVDLGPAYDTLLDSLPLAVSDLAKANIKPRLRMTTLYALAQARNYLVAGTGNKSELAVGYFTKYGDGGVDVEPLGDLFKWQVRRLAQELDIPQPVIDRSPSAGLWEGQTDEGEMGITYAVLDSALAAMENGRLEDVEAQVQSRVQQMVARSEHKRHMPPICLLEAAQV
jgi:NAD+ synthase